jgi:hypothetical protein
MSKVQSTGLLLDGVFASEAIDSSGEILDLKGMDISDFDEGKGLANYEHKGHDGDNNGQEIVGKVIAAKKIYKASDCSNERERFFWDKVKLPFLYGIVRLYDGAGHEGAKALAAIIRDSHKNNEPIIVGFSIEGSTLEKKDNRLAKTIARRVALTTRPCNKQAVSGLLADPNAPEGYETTPVKPDIASLVTEKREFDPLYQRLGGSELEYGPEMTKAMTAGSYGAAPGTLTGGAALQVEDKGRVNKAVAMAAFRDWPRTGKFRDFLKSKMPEASDEFLDHFSDLVEDHVLRIKKAEEVLADMKKAGEQPQPLVSQEPKAPPTRLTVQGKPTRLFRPDRPVEFDENKGVLHTPRGSVPMYIPSRDLPEHAVRFHEILNDPKVEKFHGYAMKNWFKAHQLLKAGKLPPQVTMHSVLFSQLSPNTPVPMQEMMYGHLVDAMKDVGSDLMNPDAAKDIKRNWLERNQPERFPDHSPEHWKRLEQSLRLKNDSKQSGRVKGDIASFMLAENKFKNMAQYHSIHKNLMALVGEHRHNAQSAVAALMDHKHQAELHDAKRRRYLKDKSVDIGDYEGVDVPGLAPKTARYMYAMMGGGNAHVPDTHFVRHLFGLSKAHDTKTINYLKNVLWSPTNHHVLDAIDRYYANNHDAVQHMVTHPKWGPMFENREDAVFPAFWKHWMAIVPHEKARGITDTFGHNELTDHKPFWEAIAPFMKKSEQDEKVALPIRTAAQHARWVTQYGAQGAQMLYFRYLLPQLLGEAAEQQADNLVRKMQSLTVDLKKGEREAPDGTLLHESMDAQPNYIRELASELPDKVPFKNGHVKPGILHDQAQRKAYALLDAGQSHYTVVNPEKVGGWEPQDLIRLPRHSGRMMAATGALPYDVVKYPVHHQTSTVIDPDRDGVGDFLHHDDVKQLFRGVDVNPENATGHPTSGTRRFFSHWTKNQDGAPVFVKQPPREDEFNEARREATYHNVARDFFGLGHYLPRVGLVRNPQTGTEHALIEGINGEHYNHVTPDPRHLKVLTGLYHSGESDKMAMMNTILSNSDRHQGNIMFPENEDTLKLIDHGLSLHGYPGVKAVWDTGHGPAYYLMPHLADQNINPTDDPIHPAAQKWLNDLDPAELDAQLRRHELPERYVRSAVGRLKALKMLAQKKNMSKLRALAEAERLQYALM